MTSRPDKRPQRLETRRRVEQKSQARNPSAGLDEQWTERVARDEDTNRRLDLLMRLGRANKDRNRLRQENVALRALTEAQAQAIALALEALKDAPSAKAPTSVARDAPSSTTTRREEGR